MELAALALKATNRLAAGALGAGPLGLLVTGRAGIGAHGTLSAAVTGNGGDDVADHLADDGHVLNARPAAKSQVVKRNSAVVGGESAAVELTVREVRVKALGRGAAGAGGGGGRCAALRAGGRSGCRSRSWGRRGCRGRASRRLLVELGRNRGRSRRVGGARAAGAWGGLAVSPLERAIGDSLAHFLGGDWLAVELILDDGRARNADNLSDVGDALHVVVTVVKVVRLGRHDGARRSKAECNGGELHFANRFVFN